jgi:signal peptidase II
MILKSFLFKIAIPIIILTAGTDRVLKFFVSHYLSAIPNKSIMVTSFFNITEIWNFGISFGLLKADDTKGIIFLLLSTLFITSLLIFFLVKAQTRLEIIALSCIIGGALGNLFDRLYYGAVYDFLDFHLSNIHFWTFNPADAFITLGAILLICDQIIVFFKNSKG